MGGESSGTLRKMQACQTQIMLFLAHLHMLTYWSIRGYVDVIGSSLFDKGLLLQPHILSRLVSPSSLSYFCHTGPHMAPA